MSYPRTASELLALTPYNVYVYHGTDDVTPKEVGLAIVAKQDDLQVLATDEEGKQWTVCVTMAGEWMKQEL